MKKKKQIKRDERRIKTVDRILSPLLKYKKYLVAKCVHFDPDGADCIRESTESADVICKQCHTVFKIVTRDDKSSEDMIQNSVNNLKNTLQTIKLYYQGKIPKRTLRKIAILLVLLDDIPNMHSEALKYFTKSIVDLHESAWTLSQYPRQYNIPPSEIFVHSSRNVTVPTSHNKNKKEKLSK